LARSQAPGGGQAGDLALDVGERVEGLQAALGSTVSVVLRPRV
jgi:hypothetical protein